jgi:hypothetical protein
LNETGKTKCVQFAIPQPSTDCKLHADFQFLKIKKDFWQCFQAFCACQKIMIFGAIFASG